METPTNSSPDELTAGSPTREYIALLAAYLRPLRGKVALLALLIFSTIGLQLVNPQIVRFFIDTALESSGTSAATNRSLWMAALLFLGVALLLQLLSVAATYVGEDVGWSSTNKLRADLARHCLGLDMSFHNDHTPGEMIERVDGDVANIAIFFAQFVIRILGNVLLIIGVLLVLLWEDWRISAALASYTIVAVAALVYIRQIAVPYWKESRQASADLFGFLEEHLAGTEDTRASGAVNYVMRNLYRLNRVRYEMELRGRTMGFVVNILWIAFYTIGQVVALLCCYWLYPNILTIGSVYLVVRYTDIIFRPLREITKEIQNLQKAAAGIERVNALFNLHPQILAEGKKSLPAGPLGVTFDNVTFGYAPEEPVLKDVSFELKPGNVLGLLGRTGSGKTTITRLLFRLYDPNTGAIHFSGGSDFSAGVAPTTGTPGTPYIVNGSHNGHANGSHSIHGPTSNGASTSNGGYLTDIRSCNIPDLRNHVGMVTQDVQLFRATVRDNLTFFDPSVPDERIMEVIHDLELAPWFDSLPKGLDTLLETEGSSLSAGEAQLLAFTRVFLKDPGLVILDEASSRLDPATEQLIERAVDKLLANRTGIIVAHRLGTVERADQIMIIDNGEVEEHGDYKELAENPQSRFAHLLRTGMEQVLV